MQRLFNALSALLLIASFTVNKAYAQQASEYFITRWNIGNNNTIAFKAYTSGTGSYYWEEIQGTLTGKGTFETGKLVVSDLPRNSVVRLRIASKTFTGLSMFDSTSTSKSLAQVEQWGTSEFVKLEDAFYNCSNLDVTAFDIPNLKNCKALSSLFYGCENLIGPSNINQWDVSSIVFIQGMFNGAKKFNQSLDKWNVSNVRVAGGMFSNAVSFNQPLNTWNTKSLFYAAYMFDGATKFNQPLNNWDLRKAGGISSMFKNAVSFNQNLETWTLDSISKASWFLDNSGMDCVNYSKLLNTMAKTDFVYPVEFGVLGMYYSEDVSTARQTLLNRNKVTLLGDGKTTDGCKPKTSAIADFERSTLSLFPNPAKNEITINSALSMNIRILNPAGQELMSINNHLGSIDISTLPSGLYFLKAKEVNTGKLSVHKFLKE